MNVTRKEYEQQRRQLVQLLYRMIDELDPKPASNPIGMIQSGVSKLLDGVIGLIDVRVMPHIERRLERIRERWEMWRR